MHRRTEVHRHQHIHYHQNSDPKEVREKTKINDPNESWISNLEPGQFQGKVKDN